MFNNIGLKLKVFFFILIVFALLSILDFRLFDSVLSKIQLQQGPENTYHYMETAIVNEQFKLIAQAFRDSRKVVLKKEATRKASFILDTHDVSPDAQYLIVEKNGAVIASNMTALNNMKGVPAVDRALTEGVASDGIISLKGKLYLMGAVPFVLKGKRSEHFFVMIEMKPVMKILKSFPFTFPIKAYFNNKMVYQTENDTWNDIFPSQRADLFNTAEQKLLASNTQVDVSRWTMLSSYSLPADFRGTSKLTVIALLSFTPGYAMWKDALYLTLAYGLIAALISLIFVFIVTHEIDRVFRRLSASLSELKVGEKIVARNYSHGAQMVVSALNTLITKYLTSGASSVSQSGDMHESFDKASSTSAVPSGDGLSDLNEDFSTATQADDKVSAPISSNDTDFSLDDDMGDTEDNEKTMLASDISMPPPFAQAPKSPFDLLWDEYRSIKVANGHRASEADKITFINKLKTQKVSIIAKYNCSDVSFSIEEKAGKAVIKAKKIL
ncbi:hypothetical protein KAH37_04990 [bacterium]|nr:hypothetical protein [bacterium]